MRLWQLAVLVIVIAAAGVCLAGILTERAPTSENDHLLDNVPGLGGPKR